MDKGRGRSEMSSSSGYNTDEDSVDIQQSEYNYNQASILSSVFYDVKDLSLPNRNERIIPHSFSSKQFKFDEEMNRTENKSFSISKGKDNRSLNKFLALLAFLSLLAFILFCIPVTINTETQFLENSRHMISNATHHFQKWSSEIFEKIDPRKLYNKNILYLPLTLASNAANGMQSKFLQFGNGVWTLSTYVGHSLIWVRNFIARCLLSTLEIFLLPLSWIPDLPEYLGSMEVLTIPGKVFGLSFEILKNSLAFVGNGIYSATFSGKYIILIALKTIISKDRF